MPVTLTFKVSQARPATPVLTSEGLPVSLLPLEDGHPLLQVRHCSRQGPCLAARALQVLAISGPATGSYQRGAQCRHLVQTLAHVHDLRGQAGGSSQRSLQGLVVSTATPNQQQGLRPVQALA